MKSRAGCPASASTCRRTPRSSQPYVAVLVTLAGTILQYCKSEKDAGAKQQIIIQQTVQVIERHGRDIDVLLQSSTRDAGSDRD
jgi:hypothetical protein